jgi:ribulose-5-phosphate 4-epimerase/fuculose-1-phosphate aldolase
VPSRPDLVEICKELGIDSSELSIEEMTEACRKEADRKWSRFNINYIKMCPVSNKSKTLLKFLTEEYDYSLFDRDGNIIDVNGNILKEAK